MLATVIRIIQVCANNFVFNIIRVRQPFSIFCFPDITMYFLNVVSAIDTVAVNKILIK